MTLIRGEHGLPANVPIITCPSCGRNCVERIHGTDSLRPGDQCDSDDCPSNEEAKQEKEECFNCGQTHPGVGILSNCIFSKEAQSLSFTRQHYVATANALRTRSEKRVAVAAMADMFAADNPNFDRARFEEACGLTPTPILASIPTSLWNAMAMQAPDCGVAKEVLNVSLLSHANGVFNHTIGLLCRMGLFAEGQDCTYEEFEAAFGKLAKLVENREKIAVKGAKCPDCGGRRIHSRDCASLHEVSG